MKVAVRPFSILDKGYQPGDVVDTRPLPQRRVDQLKKFGLLKEFDDAEMVDALAETVDALSERVAALEERLAASPDALEERLAASDDAVSGNPGGGSVNVKRGGAPKEA